MTTDGEKDKWSKAAKMVLGSQLCTVKCLLIGGKGRIPLSPSLSSTQNHSCAHTTLNINHGRRDECKNASEEMAASTKIKVRLRKQYIWN